MVNKQIKLKIEGKPPLLRVNPISWRTLFETDESEQTKEKRKKENKIVQNSHMNLFPRKGNNQ